MKVYAPERMRVAAKAEYATRAVLHLAMQHPAVVTIHEIAADNGIPVKYLEQILLELRRAAVVTSRRGVHGGYRLARDPSEISVGEVLRVVDHRVMDSSCEQRNSERGFACADSEGCGLRRVWNEVQVAIESILFTTTFAQVCAASHCATPARSNGKLHELSV